MWPSHRLAPVLFMITSFMVKTLWIRKRRVKYSKIPHFCQHGQLIWLFSCQHGQLIWLFSCQHGQLIWLFSCQHGQLIWLFSCQHGQLIWLFSVPFGLLFSLFRTVFVLHLKAHTFLFWQTYYILVQGIIKCISSGKRGLKGELIPVTTYTSRYNMYNFTNLRSLEVIWYMLCTSAIKYS